MKLSKVIVVLHLIGAALAPAAVAFAEEPLSEAQFSLALRNSLGERGTLIALMCESPDLGGHPNSRHVEFTCFRIPQAGAEAVRTGGGWSGGDGHPLGSKIFNEYLIGAYITEKNEAIAVRQVDGLDIEADVPPPWCLGSDKRLIDLTQERVNGPFAVEATGTMANKDLVITLRTKDQTYSFKWVPRRWVRLPSVVGAPKAHAAPLLGDLMKGEFCSQQTIGEKSDGHLVTILVEQPLADSKGRRKAFYYFTTYADGRGFNFLDCIASNDDKPVGSGPDKDDPAAKPSVTISGPPHGAGEKLVLKIGSEVTNYVCISNTDRILHEKAVQRKQHLGEDLQSNSPQLPELEWTKIK